MRGAGHGAGHGARLGAGHSARADGGRCEAVTGLAQSGTGP